MASLAGTTLIWRGTSLDHLWVLNAPAYRQLSPFGKIVGVPFLVLSAALAAAGVSWFGRHIWGWRLAVVIIATQVLGDLVSIVMGHFAGGRNRGRNRFCAAALSFATSGKRGFCSAPSQGKMTANFRIQRKLYHVLWIRSIIVRTRIE
jgi:hypothetical protein